jgi:hypothetical protein
MTSRRKISDQSVKTIEVRDIPEQDLVHLENHPAIP